ncbi:MAG: hypothetical protein IPM45_01340 [Acidimicrobiales bacterium]|nr:hypothetical protein [Acidimicrobiales bacterium]
MVVLWALPTLALVAGSVILAARVRRLAAGAASATAALARLDPLAARSAVLRSGGEGLRAAVARRAPQ